MSQGTPSGWYYAEGDPPNTQRYWDGNQWIGEPQTLAPTTGVPGMAYTPATGPELASPGIRIAGRLIDAILITIVGFIATQALGFGPDFGALFESIASGTEPDPELVEVGRAPIVFGVALAFFWDFLWTAFAAGTPGKLLLGARVAGAASHQSPPSPALAARRALNRLIGLIALAAVPGSAGAVGLSYANSLLTGLIALVSLILLFTDDKHRTVMDRIGGTIVTTKQ